MIYELTAIVDGKEISSIEAKASDDARWVRDAIAELAESANMKIGDEFEYVSTPQGADVYNALWEYQFSVRVAAKLPWVRNRDEPDGSS